MKLSYPIRSKFLVLCEDAVQREKVKVLNGVPLSIQLSRKGYNRSVQITISSSENKHFHSDWSGADPTRFSARIRAAARALFNQGCFGTFQVAHHTGLLTIQKISSNAVLYKKVASSQYTDGVRINKAFHDLFNSPNSKLFIARGQSCPITAIFNNKKFAASYLHENPSKVDREMQSIRFSKELKDEFKAVFPDKAGYFSIELGPNVNEYIFDVFTDADIEATEVFAKKYIQQVQHINQDDAEIDRQRRDRLKRYNRAQQAKKRIIGPRSVNQSDPILKEDIKQLYRYKCQICSEQIKKVGWTEGLNEQQELEFLTADAHHIDPLEQNGLDDPSNIICVCPNCHRKLHTGELLIEFRNDGPICQNQITGEKLPMIIHPDHSIASRTE